MRTSVMRDSPRVSVVIPVYNRKEFLAEAIDSVLAQTFRDFELILIDDGSTEEGIAELMESYTRDARVRLVRNASNQGIARVHNQSLEAARGEYVAALDSDDYAYPGRLEKQVAFLDERPGYALVGSWTRPMNASGRPLLRINRFPVDPDTIRARLLFRCYVNHPSTMGRTAVLRTYGYREDLALANDFDLFVRLARDHELGSLPKVLVRTRKHGLRASGNRDRAKRENEEIIAGQLHGLGVSFSPTDLERHFVITRKQSWLVPDRAYLDWAADWMAGLQAANRRSGLFWEPAFTRVLGEVWLTLCLRAARWMGFAAWRHFRASPLRGEAWPNLRASFGHLPRSSGRS